MISFLKGLWKIIKQPVPTLVVTVLEYVVTKVTDYLKEKWED
jgi:hypothetical protein